MNARKISQVLAIITTIGVFTYFISLNIGNNNTTSKSANVDDKTRDGNRISGATLHAIPQEKLTLSQRIKRLREGKVNDLKTENRQNTSDLNRELVKSSDGKPSPTPHKDPAAILEEYKTDPPRFEDWSEVAVTEFLQIFTLGNKESFLQNKDRFLKPLKESGQASSYLSLLKGLYKSQFVNGSPSSADEQSYYFEMFFTDNTLLLQIKLDDTVYYSHEYSNLLDNLKTSTAQNLPSNLFIELPKNIEKGYVHPMYLQIFPSSSGESFVTNLYNTEQKSGKVSYDRSEVLIFKRTSLD